MRYFDSILLLQNIYVMVTKATDVSTEFKTAVVVNKTNLSRPFHLKLSNRNLVMRQTKSGGSTII